MAKPATVKRGTEIELVRWVGNQPVLVAGKFSSRTEQLWTITIDGVEFTYPRPEWELCIR